MPRLSEIEGEPLIGAQDSVLGTVERVLFHPCEPRAVALMIKPDPLLYVVERASAYVAFDAVTFDGGSVSVGAARLPSFKDATREIGHDPDTTVIWRGMPVVSPTGAALGSVADAELAADGSVLGMQISTGLGGDVAHGWLLVKGGLVRGFDGRAVVIEAEEADLPTGGGLARKGAAAVTAVKAGASETAKTAGGAVIDASYIAGHALGSAVRSPAARKARGAWKGLVDAYREGRDGEKDERPDAAGRPGREG